MGQECVAKVLPKEILVVVLEVLEHRYHGESQVEARTSDASGPLCVERFRDVCVAACEQRPAQLLHLRLWPCFAGSLLPLAWHRQVGVHVERCGQLPVLGELQYDRPELWWEPGSLIPDRLQGRQVCSRQCNATRADCHQVDLRLYGLAQFFVSAPRYDLPPSLIVIPQQGRQDTDPVHFLLDLADLLLRHGMLPLQVRHARDQENFLRDIPAAQNF